MIALESDGLHMKWTSYEVLNTAVSREKVLVARGIEVLPVFSKGTETRFAVDGHPRSAS